MRLRKPRELAVVQAVAAWREREARDRNVPRGRVIKDDAVYEIAQQQPRDTAALSRLRTMPKGWERSATRDRPAAGGQHRARLAEGPDAAPAEAGAGAGRVQRGGRVAEGTAAAGGGEGRRRGKGAAPPATTSTASPPRARRPTCRPCMAGAARCSATSPLKLVRGEIALKFDRRKVAVFELAQ